MKKILSVILMSLMLLSCSACGGSKTQNETTPSTDPAAHSVDAIKARGEIKVATEASYAPFAFKDKSGNIVGFEPTIMQAIADELGVKLKIDDMAFESVIPAVQSGLDDVAFAAIMPTDKRLEAIDMTNVYYYDAMQMIVRAEDAEKFADESSMESGVVISVQKNTYYQEAVQTHYPDVTIRGLDSAPLCITDLKAGNCDGVVLNGHVAEGYLESNPDLAITFVVPMMPGDHGGDAGALMKGNSDLTEYLNMLIEKWTADGSLEKWYNDAVELQKQLGD